MEDKVKKIPHTRVEYATDYFGGDYNKVGSFALIPHSVIDVYDGDVEMAFGFHMNVARVHIIHYPEFEIYDQNGELMEDED